MSGDLFRGARGRGLAGAGAGAADGRGPPRPGARTGPARSSFEGVGGEPGAAVAGRGGRPQRVGLRPRPGARPHRRRGQGARKRAGHDRRVLFAAARALQSSAETRIDPEVRRWLAFCDEKLSELALLGAAVDVEAAEREELLGAARETVGCRRVSPHTNDPSVRDRVGGLRHEDYERDTPAAERRRAQRERVGAARASDDDDRLLPPDGGDPRRPPRAARGPDRRGRLRAFLEGQIAHVVEVQERLGLDVLVHGEPERNDMVEYFGQQLRGFVVHRAPAGCSPMAAAASSRRSSSATCRARRR